MQVVTTLSITPADEAIARRGFPGGGTKAERRHELPVDRDEVAQLRARQGRIVQIVIALDMFIPEPRITRGVRTDGEKLQAAEYLVAQRAFRGVTPTY